MRTTFRFFFISLLFISLSGCHREIKEPKANTVSIGVDGDPHTFDPRLTRDLSTVTVIHLLYEGLTRLDQDGKPILALAENVNVSDDLKTYLFTIRKATWSNGQPITAYDFENTWKSILDPSFPAPNAYQLYVIKGAKEAKENKIPLDQVGVKALDEQTLVVHLNHPTPYFLNLTSTYFYFPVHEQMRQKGSNEKIKPENLVSNGPFKLQSFEQQNQLTAVKNPSYWDNHSVSLEEIDLIVVENETALTLFKKNQLDIVGSPLSTIPTDALASLKGEGKLLIKPAAGVYFLRFNTEKSPFDSVLLRRAFNSALNRTALIEHILQGNQIPATSYLPPYYLESPSYFDDNHSEHALNLFSNALIGQGITKTDIPSVVLCYANGERSHKIAQVAQQQWKNLFGIHVELQSCESKVMFEKMKNLDYQIAIGSWFADFDDPISFLEVFKFKDNGTNNTQWQNTKYIQLLNQSAQTTDSEDRARLLAHAEKVLLEEMPIAPLFFASYNYMQNPHVKGIYFSPLGYLDFKWAYKDSK